MFPGQFLLLLVILALKRWMISQNTIKCLTIKHTNTIKEGIKCKDSLKKKKKLYIVILYIYIYIWVMSFLSVAQGNVEYFWDDPRKVGSLVKNPDGTSYYRGPGTGTSSYITHSRLRSRDFIKGNDVIFLLSLEGELMFKKNVTTL